MLFIIQLYNWIITIDNNYTDDVQEDNIAKIVLKNFDSISQDLSMKR